MAPNRWWTQDLVVNHSVGIKLCYAKYLISILQTIYDSYKSRIDLDSLSAGLSAAPRIRRTTEAIKIVHRVNL